MASGPHTNDPKTQYKQEMVDDVTARDSVTVNGLGNRQVNTASLESNPCHFMRLGNATSLASPHVRPTNHGAGVW